MKIIILKTGSEKFYSDNSNFLIITIIIKVSYNIWLVIRGKYIHKAIQSNTLFSGLIFTSIFTILSIW